MNNNKSSLYILMAIVFVILSCKSEVKTRSAVHESTNANNQIIERVDSEQNSNDEGTKVISNTDEEDKKDHTSMPNNEPTTQNNALPKDKSEKKKPVVDVGIEIEMGMEGTDKETEIKETVKDAKKEIDTVIEEDNPAEEETKPAIIETVKEEKPSKPVIIDRFKVAPKHSLFGKLLKSNVSATGDVNYKNLKNQEAQLDEYLSLLENYPPKTDWTRDQKLVYWINAYNAFTLKLILKNYPIKSITDLHGGKPWDEKWINLDGKTLSLNNIENDIIRPKFNEPRIHFAVNCAAKSCPPLLNESYEDNTLDAQLDAQTKKFINNLTFNTLGKNEIEVSKIFEWYKDDFGDIVSFVMAYANTTVKPNAKVSFKTYDWALNGR